jgi:hypothetical protein
MPSSPGLRSVHLLRRAVMAQLQSLLHQSESWVAVGEPSQLNDALGKKATMAIPNHHDSVLNIHTLTTLIQLFQADDRVPQCGHVVESDEQSMLTRLSGEDDGADALDLHTGGVPKLDGASNIGVKLSEELPSTDHVMGGTGVEAPPVSLIIVGAVAE